MTDNVVNILGFGSIGLGLLLALLAYKLLSEEQKKERPREKLIRAIYVFMAFSVGLTLIGLAQQFLAGAPKKETAKKQELNLRPDGYEIQGVHVTLQIEKEDDTHQVMNVTTQYFIQAQKDFTKNDQATFRKRYSKSYATSVALRPGLLSETLVQKSANSYATNSHFIAKKGDLISLVYGARVRYKLPLADGIRIRDRVELSVNEQWWGYPNTHGYRIKNISMSLESQTYTLLLPDNKSILRFKAGQQPLTMARLRSIKTKSDDGSAILGAAWSDVDPNELVAIRFAFIDSNRP